MKINSTANMSSDQESFDTMSRNDSQDENNNNNNNHNNHQRFQMNHNKVKDKEENEIQEHLIEDDETFKQNKPGEDLYRKQKRYYFLPFACLILIGGFFNNTFQAFIKEQFMDSMHIQTDGYNLFVLIPPLPNIILPVFSGHVYSWLNLRRGLFIFSLMMVVGMSLCLIASYSTSLPLMIAGKTIHQIGNEMLCIGQSAMVSIWFDSETIAFAFTWGSFVSKLSGSLAGIIFPQLYNIEDNLYIPLFVSVGTCAFSFLCTLVVVYYDHQAELRLKNYNSKTSKQSGGLTMKQLKSIPSLFWIYAAQAALLYGSFYAFESYLHAILVHKFGIDKTSAGTMTSIPFWIAFSAPAFGILADKFGKRIFCLMGTSLTAMISIVILLIFPGDTPVGLIYVPLVAFGIFLSMMAAYLFPAYPLICKKDVLKAAFGFGYAAKNAGLSLFGFVGGQILGSDEEQYNEYLIFFIAIFVVSTLIQFYGYFLDKKNAEGNMNSKKPIVPIESQILASKMSLGGSFIS